MYESAGKYLSVAPQHWDQFVVDFQGIFGAAIVLYQPTFEKGVMAWRSVEQTIATTHPEYADDYVKYKVFESNQISDDSLNPLEPSRRSDIIPDDVYRVTGVANDFFIPRGIFHMLAVSAILPDETHLMMVLWRSEDAGDFSDIEKQRMALFMRYLATLVPSDQAELDVAPGHGVEEFGAKYALTETEVSVLAALLQGQSLRMIADESGRAYGTVRWHVQNILEKCQVKTQKNLLSEFYRLIKR